MIDNAASFHAEAAYQRECASCEQIGQPFEAHHAIKSQRLRRSGKPTMDPRLAIRLCEGLGTLRCHYKVEKQGQSLPTEKLRDETICAIWEHLGVAGQNLLEADYSGVDRRYTRHPEGKCPLCQV